MRIQRQQPVLQVKQLKDTGCEAQAIQCDVSIEKQQEEAFQMHMQQFKRLDIAILNAGIGDTGQLMAVHCMTCIRESAVTPRWVSAQVTSSMLKIRTGRRHWMLT